MANRTQRQPRQARAARRDPRAGLFPDADGRRRRGPKPPDAILSRLATVLQDELRAGRGGRRTDAAEDTDRAGLSATWLAALAAAVPALLRGARRGVVGALAGTAAAALARTTPAPEISTDGWVDEVTEDLEEVIARHREQDSNHGTLLAAVLAVLGGWVMGLHAWFVQQIARAAGARWYVWTTMLDERVRELHQLLESSLQSWDAPPLAGLPAFHGHPGEAAGCRCQAFPLL
jgi:hypothetical protein